MNVQIIPLEWEHAEEIVSWHYEPPYDIYDPGGGSKERAIEYLTDRRNHVYALLDGSRVIGFRSFGEDGRVSGGDYDESYLDTGGGLRPNLVGRGLGAEVIRQGLEFGRDEFGTQRFRVTIAAFNGRAIKVCERIGFREVERFLRPRDEAEFVILSLDQLARRGDRPTVVS